MAAASSPEIARDWRFVALIGCACFPASLALFYYAVPLGAWIAATSESWLAAFGAGLATALAMLFAGLAHHPAHAGRQLAHARRASTTCRRACACSTATSGWSICNSRYMELYQLSDDVVKPGRTLTSLLEYRIANGTFSRDPEEYRRELVAAMAEGKTITNEVKSATGRMVFVINRPMADGGWVATHEDITERRDAERERASMQEQQQRRAMIEHAIAAFRQRVEDHLRTVTDGAMAMRSTADHAVREFRADLATRRWRGVGVERSQHQCRDRRDRRRRTGRLDRRDQPPARR